MTDLVADEGAVEEEEPAEEVRDRELNTDVTDV